MPIYRIYAEFHMCAYQDIHAVSEADALDQVKEDDDTDNWTIDGSGNCPLGMDLTVYSVDGKRV